MMGLSGSSLAGGTLQVLCQGPQCARARADARAPFAKPRSSCDRFVTVSPQGGSPIAHRRCLRVRPSRGWLGGLLSVDESPSRFAPMAPRCSLHVRHHDAAPIIASESESGRRGWRQLEGQRGAYLGSLA
jgi:hypothetical protein